MKTELLRVSSHTAEFRQQATPDRTVVFMTPDADPLVGEFARASAMSCAGELRLTFLFSRQSADWAVAWICDETGAPTVWLYHFTDGQYVLLGADARDAMKDACRIIRGEQSIDTGQVN